MNIDAILLKFAFDDGLDPNIMQHIVQLVEPLPQLEEILNRRRGDRLRNREYFEITIPRYTDDQFQQHFRMTRNTFEVSVNTTIFFSSSYRQE